MLKVNKNILYVGHSLPKRITFIISDSLLDSVSYQKRIEQYFESHGNCTEIKFSSANISDIDSVTDRLSKQIDEKTIICLTVNPSQIVTLAVGRYFDKCPIISLGKFNKIVSYNLRFTLPSFIKQDGIKLSDYFELSKWESKDLFSKIIPKELCVPIEKFYFDNVNKWNNSIIDYIKNQTY